MSDSERRPEQEAFDQFGQYLQMVGELGSRTWSRSFALWTDVGSSLDKEVTTGTLTANTARAMTLMQRNLQDAWQTFSRPPTTQRTATVLPTAFLSFVPGPGSGYTQLPGTVRIPATSAPEPGGAAKVTLRSTEPKEQTAVEAVRSRLRVTYSSSYQAFLLEGTDGSDPKAELSPGSYEGLVYLTKPSMALATLHVVVEPAEQTG